MWVFVSTESMQRALLFSMNPIPLSGEPPRQMAANEPSSTPCDNEITGYVGVSVFFVLSGFVIAISIARAKITWQYFTRFAV